MLDWFVEEQGEEEANAARHDHQHGAVRHATATGLYDLDREYATRAYTAPTTLPM